MLGLDIWSGSILINLVVAFALASLTAFMLQKPTVDRNIGLAFLSVELVLAVWSLGYLGSYLSEEFASSYWWHHLAFAAICFFGVSWLIFSLASTGRARWLACRRLAVLVAPSVLFLLGVVTNDWHRLFFTAVSFRGSGTLETSYGPLFWAHTVVTYSYLVVGVILYLRFSPAQTGWFRRLKYMFMFAVIPPVAINILVISKTITTSIDLTPLTVTLPVITCAIALYRYWIFNVVQSALAQAMEQNCDAVVVIDLQHRILDANIAFGRLVQVPRAALVGRSIHDVSVQLGGKEELLEQLSVRLSTRQDHPGERVSDDIVVRGVPRQVYELLVEPIRGPDVDLIGRMATLRDVTTAREVTHNLEEAVANLRAVHETAVAITSMHDLGGVLGVILNEVHRLTFADHASIATLDREGNLFTTRAHAHNGVELNLTPTSRLPSTLSRDILREGEARFVEDVIQAGAQRSSTMTNSTQAYAGVPLVNQNRPVGILYLAYNQPHTFAKADRLLIQTLAIHAAVAINNAQMFDEINLAASTDALTGLPNHRHLMDRLDEEIARAIRSEHPLAIMMIDIDDFKLVNDAHGHTKGDDLLRLVSKTLRDTLRSTDKIGRYGGDEFLALLPETDRDEAILVADRLLTAIRNLDFRVPRRGDCVTPDPAARSADTPRDSRVAIPIHLSIGVAVYPHDSSNRPELISLADTAMYASKRGGGNMATLVHATDSGFLAAQNATFSVLEGLVNAVDGKDRYTRVHSECVAQFGLALAQCLGLTADSKRMIRIASLLHDVGKIGIPDRILRKPGELDDEERQTIKQHPLLSEMIIREVPQLTDVLEAVRHHHERYDGSGYPRGLKGDEIPFFSRIIAIADAYSAMILDRPYRKALPTSRAIEELRRNAGSQFDPELVDVFVQWLTTSQPSPDLESQTSEIY